MAVVLGIDPSLTGTGLCRLGFPGRPPETGRIATKSTDESCVRLIEIRDSVARLLRSKPPPDLVAIEGYSFGSKGRSVVQAGELGGILRVLLHESGIMWIEVAPSQVKKFGAGKGNIDKSEMGVPVFKRWGLEFRTNDERDAFILAKIAQAILDVESNREGEKLIKPQVEVIRAIRYGKDGDK